jgi:DNA-binding Lrp family transcriptional regulator
MNRRDYRQEDSNTSEMRRMEKPLKDVELRLVSELVKNSRRSDRELAKVIGVSQPTVSRTIKKLEEQGIIKEYTIIPDFVKLGYQIMGVSFATFEEPQKNGTTTESRKAVEETEQKHPHASLIAVRGIGLGKDTMFITFYKDYSAYTEAMQLAKRIPHVSIDSLASFLVDLNDKSNYRLLSMSTISHHILTKKVTSHK